MSKTLYGVSTGEYSDWTVVAVFEDQEFAKKYACINNCNNFLTEIPLNPEVDETLILPGMQVFSFWMSKEGDTWGHNISKVYATSKDENRIYSYHSTQWHCMIVAESQEHAIKIAAEKRRIKLAE